MVSLIYSVILLHIKKTIMKKKFFFVATAVLMVIAGTMIFGTSAKKSSSIPFDAKAASRHIMNGADANKFIEAFKVERQKINNETTDFAIAETFNRDAIAALLNVPGTESVRAYHAKNEKGEIILILKPVDKNGNDIKAKITTSVSELEEGNTISLGTRCPPDCVPPPPPPPPPAK